MSRYRPHEPHPHRGPVFPSEQRRAVCCSPARLQEKPELPTAQVGHTDTGESQPGSSVTLLESQTRAGRQGGLPGACGVFCLFICLFFHIKLSFILSRCVKNCVGM